MLFVYHDFQHSHEPVNDFGRRDCFAPPFNAVPLWGLLKP
jgi:hypothetical protein